ncbi:MAG TPA: beta-glucuronidase [Lentisphaeria bacterium]|nr:MAG: beta-glucuronidase [Lentisphaerae bacterium GWF2_49_21]HBC88337.1 beta-glucuronidase [Lentisphaeria bacterium]
MAKNSTIPRPEHPKPQFERESWINLNGQWTYAFDFGKSGAERGFKDSKGFAGKITVPFCPESELSGVGYKDFIEMMWYQKDIQIPKDWRGSKVILHFGAVDYIAEIFVDGRYVGRHFGGSSSFDYDISDYVEAGKKHSLVLHVSDDTRHGKQPGGKQSFGFKSAGCHYTRTTGIWQTVWLEAVSEFSLQSCRILPDLDGNKFLFTPLFRGMKRNLKVRIAVKDGEKIAAKGEFPAQSGVPVQLAVGNPKVWSPESPFLYSILFEVVDGGKVVDSVKSYAGIRKVHIEGDTLYLNNKPYYLRLVLDQGFYPDGIWTAPSDSALKKDIELSMKAGFNGARLHQKVFEERFHYWADKLGYLTWGEFPSWGTDVKDPVAARNFITEWAEVVARDLNHPSIIAWTPLNETWDTGDGVQHSRFHADLYDITKSLDPTRPVNEASGYVHVKTDLWTVHNYEQNPEKLKAQLTPDREKGVWRNHPEKEVKYQGQPYFVDEFGGIKWVVGAAFADNTWGYGDAPKSLEEVYNRLEGQVNALLSHKHIKGYCYTQLTDVEQEQNGIYNYDRSEKFDMKKIRKILSKNP